MTQRVIAHRDDRLGARIVGRRVLHYDEGADPGIDRPAHVRAGSSLAWFGTRLAVAQDDANFLAIIEPDSGAVSAVTLPAGAMRRRQFDDRLGNKADKLDLEALASVPQADGTALLVAFGSGSSSRRETIVLVRTSANAAATVVEVRHVPALFAAVRAASSFAGSELNIEGAVYSDGTLRLFNRGNGAARADVGAVDATAELDWTELITYLNDPVGIPLPTLGNVIQFELGVLGGTRLTFTDAAVLRTVSTGSEGSMLYSATAEASPDAIRDGPVAGSAIGVIARRSRRSARWTPLRGADGALFDGKVEGIATDRTDPRRAYVVVDRDLGGVASELCEVLLEGPWFEDD